MRPTKFDHCSELDTMKNVVTIVGALPRFVKAALTFYERFPIYPINLNVDGHSAEKIIQEILS
jgi:hypothetical protein